MRRPPALLALAGALLASLTPAPALADSPKASTDAAVGVTSAGATLLGTITSSGVTTYHFEWGTTTAYGSVAPSTDGAVPSGAAAHQMSQTLTGLAPGTTYHYRLVAANDKSLSRGADLTFTTSGSPGANGKSVAAAGPAGSVETAGTPAQEGGAVQGEDATTTATTTPGAAAQPALGTTVVGAAATGTVLVRTPGQDRFAELRAGAPLPVGTVIDAAQGTFTLTSSLDADGHTQTATFWGGRFTVNQPKDGKGIVELRLAGTPAGCGKGLAKAAARKKPIRVWGQDDHGRFRTQGRFSAATVRGTRWLTTETCAGTRTTVAKGAVSVFDKVRHRTVLVRAGQTYLARRR